LGHFICARAAAEVLGLEMVLVIPACIQPHKREVPAAPPEVRWEMVKALCAQDPLFKPDRMELDRGGVSYTVETLAALRQSFPAPDYELFCLIGADALPELDTWKDPERISGLAHLAAMRREGANEAAGGVWGARVRWLSTPLVEVSSTDIRRRVREGLPVRLMVGRQVEEIIRKYGLYGARIGE